MRNPYDHELVLALVLGVALSFAGFGEWHEQTPPSLPDTAQMSRMTEQELQRRHEERAAFIANARERPRPIPMPVAWGAAFGGFAMALCAVVWLGSRHNP